MSSRHGVVQAASGRGGALGAHHADAAGAEGRHAVVEAERRHVAARRLGGLEDGRARLDLDAARRSRLSRARPGSSSRRSSGRRVGSSSARPGAAQLVREVRDQRADRRRHARRRARTASPARASRAAPRAGRGRASPGRSTISKARCSPIRHGKHLPQLSCAPNSSRWRASARMSVRSSKARMPPWPTMQPSAASSSKSNGVSSFQPGRMPPSGPPICTRLDRVAVHQAAAELLADLRHRRAEAHLVHARPHEAVVEADELGARRRAGAERRVGLRPVQRR